jgi:membrane protein
MPNIFIAAARFFKKRFHSAGEKVRNTAGRLKQHLTDRQMNFVQLVFRSVRFALTRHEIPSRASAIAFCAMMAFVPFITLAITIGAHLLPDLGGTSHLPHAGSAAAQEVAQVLQTLFPANAADLILDQIARIQAQPPLAIISVTLLLALWTSSGLYTEIINSLNRILGVPETRSLWSLRLRTMAMVMLQTLVFFIAFVAIVVWPRLMHLTHLSGWLLACATLLHWLILFAIIYASFAIIFHLGPDRKTKHHWVSPGSFFGTFVFLVTTFGFRLYLEHFARYSTAYGSLGGVMMLMFWFWLISLVLLISAEINKLAALTEDKK